MGSLGTVPGSQCYYLLITIIEILLTSMCHEFS